VLAARLCSARLMNRSALYAGINTATRERFSGATLVLNGRLNMEYRHREYASTEQAGFG
jgi:hypothetical protein